MAMSKHLGMYRDVHELFENVLKANKTCTINFPTKSAMLQWRQRAYYYRKLLHDKQAQAMGQDIGATSTPYDAFIFRTVTGDPLALRIESAYSPDNIQFDEDVTEAFGPATKADDLEADRRALEEAANMLNELDL